MKLFVRGGVSLVAVLFASYLIFSAKPLLAEIKPSSEPATQQPEKQEPTQAAQPQKKEAEQTTGTTTAPTETAELFGEVAVQPVVGTLQQVEPIGSVVPVLQPQVHWVLGYAWGLAIQGNGDAVVRLLDERDNAPLFFGEAAIIEADRDLVFVP